MLLINNPLLQVNNVSMSVSKRKNPPKSPQNKYLHFKQKKHVSNSNKKDKLSSFDRKMLTLSKMLRLFEKKSNSIHFSHLLTFDPQGYFSLIFSQHPKFLKIRTSGAIHGMDPMVVKDLVRSYHRTTKKKQMKSTNWRNHMVISGKSEVADQIYSWIFTPLEFV